jgi:hypothetical protein
LPDKIFNGYSVWEIYTIVTRKIEVFTSRTLGFIRAVSFKTNPINGINFLIAFGHAAKFIKRNSKS